MLLVILQCQYTEYVKWISEELNKWMKMKKEKRNLSTSTGRRTKTALQVGEYSILIKSN